MAGDNNSSLPGAPFGNPAVSNPTMPAAPGSTGQVTSQGEVLNKNERVVTEAELKAALKNAERDATAPDGTPKKPDGATAPEPESGLRGMLKRVQQAVQNAQEKAAVAEKAEREQANAQYFAQSQENRGILDPVDSNGHPVHTLGSTTHAGSEASAENHAATGFHPFQSMHDAVQHVQDGVLDQLRSHLPHQDPAPIVDLSTPLPANEYAHLNPAALPHTEAAAHNTHEAASHSGLNPFGALQDVIKHAQDGIVGELHAHLAHQPPAPIVDLSEPAPAVASAQAASSVHAHEAVAPFVTDANHSAGSEQVAQPIPTPDVKVSALESAAHIIEGAGPHTAHASEQVAQPIPTPDIKVSPLETAAHTIEGAGPHTAHASEQVAQPIPTPDVKVTALETGPTPATSHSAESLVHGPIGAVHDMANAAGATSGKDALHVAENVAAAHDHLSPQAALQGVQGVDPQSISAAAAAALQASRSAAHVGEPVAAPHTQVAELHTPSHIAHGGAHAHAHHAESEAMRTAAAQTPVQPAREHETHLAENKPSASHSTDHLAGVHAAAAAAIAAAAEKARETAGLRTTSHHESVASSEPHFKGVGLESKADLFGLDSMTAGKEKARTGQLSDHEFAGRVTPAHAAPSTFADDHKARSDVHNALVEQWAKAGVPVQEAHTSVAAIAPKLEQHLQAPAHPDAKLAYYSKGEVAVAIEHPHHHTGEHPTASVAMTTLHDVHKHGMPHEAIAAVQANLGKEAAGLSKLDLMDKFGPSVVRAVGAEGFPHAEVAETKFHLEEGMRNAGAKSPEVSKSDALQALGVVATDSSPQIQAMDKTTGQSYQFTTTQLQQALGFENERTPQAPSAPSQQLAQSMHQEYAHR